MRFFSKIKNENLKRIFLMNLWGKKNNWIEEKKCFVNMRKIFSKVDFF